MSVLVGLSVFLTAALNLVPKSVLLGIFLYMGISATAGIQFLERTILFLMPVKHHPNVAYVKKVSICRRALLFCYKDFIPRFDVVFYCLLLIFEMYILIDFSLFFQMNVDHKYLDTFSGAHMEDACLHRHPAPYVGNPMDCKAVSCCSLLPIRAHVPHSH